MKRTYALSALVSGALALGLVLAAQAADSDSTALEKLVKQMRQAQMDNDVSWYEKHLADGYAEGHSWGEWQDKATVIKDAQAKSTKISKGDTTDLKVTHYGPKVAVARYRFTYDAMFNGTHRARAVICSDTWVDQSGGWKLAANHCSHVEGT